jgi:DNA-binding PadR family transcriptional regulator
MELSKSSAKVLREFLKDPSEEQYGFGLMRSTRVKSGSLYPILERFERLRWIEGYKESIDEHAEGRPRRRLYRLTALGEREARRAVAEFYQDVGRPPVWVPRIEGT